MVEQKTQFRLEPSDIKAAMQLASSRTMPVPTSLVLGAGAAVLALAMWVFRSEQNWTTDYLLPILALLLIMLALFQYGLLPWQARKLAQQTVALRDDVTLEWDDEGLRLSGSHGLLKMAWHEFHRWSESKTLILLYQSDMIFHVLPKTALNDDEASDIVSRLKAASVKKR